MCVVEGMYRQVRKSPTSCYSSIHSFNNTVVSFEGMYRQVTGSGGFAYCCVFFVLSCLCICIYIHICICIYIYLGKDRARELAAKIYGIVAILAFACGREVGGWGRDPKKCTGRDWGMGSSTI